jgi:VanZ family protein
LPEYQARLQKPRVLAWLHAWWPALLWAGVIFVASTDAFSSEHTASVFEPILRLVVRSLTREQFEAIHHLIRKSAHSTEYFIFCLLLYRGVRGKGKGWRLTWGLAAFFCAAGYSVLDEFHQSFVASRVASPYDSLLDSIGAFFAMGVLWMWFRWRRPPGATKIAAGKAPSASETF